VGDDDARRRTRAPEPRGERWVRLDGEHARARVEQRTREHAAPGADVHDELAGDDAGVRDQLACETATAEKMPSARALRCASGDGHGPSPSSSRRRLYRMGALSSAAVDPETLRRYASLIVEVGANVQAGQIVYVQAEPRAAPLVRAVAEAAYERGAKFVDAWYFDPHVKRIRLERAREDTLGFVPPWYGDRLLALGEQHCARITLTPLVPPGTLNGIDPARTSRDALPTLADAFRVINAQTTNWTVSLWPTPDWAQLVHPGLGDDAATAELWRQLEFVLRLDEPDPAEAWRARLRELQDAAARMTAAGFDALRFDGPGTELTVGLLPTSRFLGGTATTVDGVEHA